MGNTVANLANLSVTTGLSQVRFEKHLTDTCVGTLWLGRYLNGHDAGRTVVLRRISRQWLTAADADWVRQGASAYSQVRHPSLTKLLGVVENGDDLIGISEHLEGVRLRDLMRTVFTDGVPVPATVAVRMVLDMARATWAAHGVAAEIGLPQSLRLFLPEGVLVSSYGATLLSEVGMLSALARCLVPRTVPALLAQLSPEELGAKAAHAGSAEVFSLGVVLWELLANRWLFSHESDSRTHQDMLLSQIRSLRHAEKYGLDLPDTLIELVTKATLRDPSQRFGSVQELIQAIEQLPTSAIASEHHVAEVLRQRSPLLLAQSKSEEAERTISGTFAEIGATSPSIVPPGAEHDWDRPTFAQRSLVDAPTPEPQFEARESLRVQTRPSTPPFAAAPLPSTRPKRQRWGWFAVGLLLTTVGGGAWFFREAPLLRRLMPSPAPASAVDPSFRASKPKPASNQSTQKKATANATAAGVENANAAPAVPVVLPADTIKAPSAPTAANATFGTVAPTHRATAGRTTARRTSAARSTATAAPSATDPVPSPAKAPATPDSAGIDLQWGI